MKSEIPEVLDDFVGSLIDKLYAEVSSLRAVEGIYFPHDLAYDSVVVYCDFEDIEEDMMQVRFKIYHNQINEDFLSEDLRDHLFSVIVEAYTGKMKEVS